MHGQNFICWQEGGSKLEAKPMNSCNDHPLLLVTIIGECKVPLVGRRHPLAPSPIGVAKLLGNKHECLCELRG